MEFHIFLKIFPFFFKIPPKICPPGRSERQRTPQRDGKVRRVHPRRGGSSTQGQYRGYKKFVFDSFSMISKRTYVESQRKRFRHL